MNEPTDALRARSDPMDTPVERILTATAKLAGLTRFAIDLGLAADPKQTVPIERFVSRLGEFDDELQALISRGTATLPELNGLAARAETEVIAFTEIVDMPRRG